MLTNILYWFLGISFLFLAKVKNILKGYSSPKPFSINEYEKCISYNIKVVDHWLAFLNNYSGNNYSIEDKCVLEVGPGSDLGIGLYLLYKGVLKYSAFDVHNLVKNVPDDFYESLFEQLKKQDNTANIESLRNQLNRFQTGNSDKLNYICRQEFDLVSSIGKDQIDIIFSQAAFEHFDDVENSIRQISAIAKTGAFIVTEIDLKTHSRWIRDKDPLNIYRYRKWLYNLFRFRGTPNRIRPFQYVKAFENNGWVNIKLMPLTKVDHHDFEKVRYYMDSEFLDEKNQMNYLSIMICAQKA